MSNRRLRRTDALAVERAPLARRPQGRLLGDELDPTGIDDDDVGRVPVAVDIQPIIETPAVGGVDYGLRKLGTLNVRRDTDTLRFHFRHFLAGLHLPRRQVAFLWVARRHCRDFATVDLS